MIRKLSLTNERHAGKTNHSLVCKGDNIFMNYSKNFIPYSSNAQNKNIVPVYFLIKV